MKKQDEDKLWEIINNDLPGYCDALMFEANKILIRRLYKESILMRNGFEEPRPIQSEPQGQMP